jgi:glycosyltransferase involved in cell wall biosynthesis
MTRVLIFGTHPSSTNGYSYVVYELAKQLSKRKDIDVSIFGFQHFSNIPNHRTDLPSNVYVYDAFADENPKQAGFGVTLVKDFVLANRPDVCIVYNDMLVLTSIINQLKDVPNRKFKIIAYIDQVYLCQKKEYINFVNQNADVAMLFTPFWEKCIKDQGITLETCYLRHGFNPMLHFPVPKALARKFFGLKNEDFIILNQNRNQPRKRYDICLQAFAEIVKRFPDEPIKLLLAASVTTGAWNLLELFERELKKRGLTLQDGMKHIILLDNPQQTSDEDSAFLMNVADIGINTCDGEGFGLVQFQQAGMGIPQIVPKIGGFLDFFDDDCALMVEPVISYYVDNSRDLVCGEAQLCRYKDYADAIEKYYFNKELREQHGKRARDKIATQYSWESIGDHLYDIVQMSLKVKKQTVTETKEAATLPQKDMIPLNMKAASKKKKADDAININMLSGNLSTKAPPAMFAIPEEETKSVPDSAAIIEEEEKPTVKSVEHASESTKGLKEKMMRKKTDKKEESSSGSGKDKKEEVRKAAKEALKEKLKAKLKSKDG